MSGETNQTATPTTPTVAPVEQAPAQPAQAKTAKPQDPKAQPQAPEPPKNPGSQFAALDRREKAVKAREAEIRALEQAAQKTIDQAKEFEGLTADQIIERVAKARNATPEDLIKSYIAKATGAPSADKLIAESKDPAVQALYQQIRERDAALKELREKLEAKDKSEQEAQQRASVAAVQAECLSSASNAWSDESDFPLFFEDKADLSNAVFRYCANRVSSYVTEHGMQPDEDQIVELIKAAPKLIIDEIMASPRGKRIAGLRKPELQAPPEARTRPNLSPNRVAVVTRPEEPPQVRTKTDRNKRLAEAKARLPEGARFPGL